MSQIVIRGAIIHHTLLLRPQCRQQLPDIAPTHFLVPIRHDHSATVGHKSKSVPATQSRLQRPPSRVNPPESTLPPPLEVSARREDQPFYSYLYHSGRAYYAFYKTGIINIWENRKAAKALKKRLRNAPPSDEASQHLPSNLTRAEFQLLNRNRSDMARVPAFGLLLALAGEWLPLFVAFVTPIVPGTCKIPSQIQTERERLELRRRTSFDELADRLHLAASDAKSSSNIEVLIQRAPREAVLHLCRSFNLHSTAWDRLSAAFPLPLTPILRWRLKRYSHYLQTDDGLLRRDGGVQGLSGEEVKRACVERGIGVLGRKDEDCRRALTEWVTKGTGPGVGGLLKPPMA